MKKRFWLFLLAILALGSISAQAQTGAFNGFCTSGARSAVVSGLNSTNKLQQVNPSCTITVYLTGTTTKALIFKDGINTPLSNPFTGAALGSTAPGQWLFFADKTQAYDVTMSGGIAPNIFTTPVTLTGLQIGAGGGGGGACTGNFPSVAYLSGTNTCSGDPLFSDLGNGLGVNGGLKYTGNGALFDAENSGSYLFTAVDPNIVNGSANAQFNLSSAGTNSATFGVNLTTTGGTNSGDINLRTSGPSLNGNNIFLTAISSPSHGGSGIITSEGSKVVLKADVNEINLQSVGGVTVTSGSLPTFFVDGVAFSTTLVASTPYAIPSNDETTTLYNANSGNIAATLPASPTDGRIFIQKKVDSSANTVTITPTGGAIDGAGSVVLKAQYQWVALQWDVNIGDWHVFASGPFSSGTLTAGHCVQVDSTGTTFVDSGVVGCSGAGGGGSAFNAITSGTNTTATMTVGTGGTLNHSGSGIIDSTKINGVSITGTPSTGQIPIATGSTTATWQASPSGLGFNTITSGTNTTAAMLVGTGASLAPTGSGTIAATTSVALATLPTPCGMGQYTTGIDTQGNAICAALPTQPASQYIAPQAMSGCGVEYVTGLQYTIGACTYSINGVIYHSPLTNVTLSAADPSNPRIDAIFVDTTQTVNVLMGTAAVSPQQPTVDPSTQLELTFVLVPAAATTPGNTTLVDIYLEGVEWVGAKGGTNGSRVNLTSTSNPYTGTHDTEFGVGGTVAATTFAGYTVPSSGTVNLQNYNTLTFYMRNKAAWATTNSVTVQWFNGTTLKGTGVVISNGAFGWNATTNTTTYQQISIPTSIFGLAGVPVTSVRFTVSGTGAALTGFYLDQITLQGGSGGPSLPATLMNFKGPWSSTATYNPNDVVTVSGVGYVALATNTNVAVTTTATWSALGGAGGSLSSFAAPSAGWPTWLVPTVATPTTTPSLTVAAGPIPYAAFSTIPANSVLGALTGTTPSAIPVPSCPAGQALSYTAGVGYSCVTAGGGGGGGNTTSTSLTNNFLPKANGVNSIIDSGLKDTGSQLVYNGSGTVNSFSLTEGTADTPVVGQDILNANASTHTLDLSLNGGAFVPIGGGGTSNPATCTSSNATNICITLAPYYASGDGATTTTTTGTFGVGTTGTIGSCSTFSANQGILIVGAGAASANYIGTVVSCSGTTLTITPSTSTSVSGAVVQHDETAAFQGAINAIGALTQPIGTIWVPNSGFSKYLIGGPLQDTGGANAQLVMPVLANYGATRADITIDGFSPANNGQFSGSILQFSTTTGGGIGGYDVAAGGGFSPFTNVGLHIKNLTILTPTNVATKAIDASHILALEVKNVLLRTQAATVPSNVNGIGIQMPMITNAYQNEIDNVTIAGYAKNIVVTEHTHIGRLYTETGIYGVFADNGTNAGAPGTYNGNAISADYIWAFQNTNGIGGGTHITTISFQDFDSELNTSDVTDSSNNVRGYINIQHPYNNGPDHCRFNITGAANLGINSLYCAGSIQTVFTGTEGAGFTATRYLGPGGSAQPTFFGNLVGTELYMGDNATFDGSNFVYAANGFASSLILSAGSTILSMCPSGTAGATADIAGACVAEFAARVGASDSQWWINPQTAAPSWPTNARFVINPSGNWWVDSSGGEHNTNVTDSALTSGNCVQASTGGLLTTTSGPCSGTIASGATALGTSAISSAACATVVTATATGTASTDAISWNPNGSIKAVTGYVPSTAGGLTIAAYPTTNAVNFDVCNWTSGSITPGAVTINWRVVR